MSNFMVTAPGMTCSFHWVVHGSYDINATSVDCVTFFGSVLQEATDVYKRLLLEHRDFLALNVYLGLCYSKLDYFDVSLEILQAYLQQYPDSAAAVNLKACNLFKLYAGKAAETEIKVHTWAWHEWRSTFVHASLHGQMSAASIDRHTLYKKHAFLAFVSNSSGLPYISLQSLTSIRQSKLFTQAIYCACQCLPFWLLNTHATCLHVR